MVEKDAAFLKKLRATFAAEAREHLGAISSGLVELEKSPTESRRREIVETIFREAHSLKGAARVVSFTEIESVCRPLEDLLAALKRESISLSRGLFDLLHDAVGGLERLLEANGQPAGTAVKAATDSVIARLDAAAKGEPIDAPPPKAAPGRPAGRRRRAAEHGAPPPPSASAPPEPARAAAETIRVDTGRLDGLFRQAEEMISAKLSAEQRLRDLRELAGALAERRTAWTRVRGTLTGAPRNGAGSGVSKLSEEVDAELASLRALSERLAALTDSADGDLRALRKMIDGLLEDAKSLLMLPLSSVFEMLPGLVRSLARDGGKEVELAIEGAEMEIDRRIQEAIKDPLVHIVRNCVDHGVEPPAERQKKNKPAAGVIRVTVTRLDGARAEVAVADDGAGIDREAVLSAAQKMGLVTAEEAASLDEAQAAELIFRSGVSTSRVVTDISGRGLGLAIVREKVERVGGSLSLETRRGAGTTFRIVVPLTLAALRGVVVRAGGRLFALSTTGVERVARVRREDVRTVENRETVQINGRAVSLARLADVLGVLRASAPDAEPFEQIVILAAKGERIAFTLEGILGEQEILVKGLGGRLAGVRNISGVTTLGTGALVPFLNVPDLVASGAAAAAPAPVAARVAAPEEPRSVLVVEDSITARTLLKNILEAAGYQVKTAVDGVDALTTLKTEPFDLVVSDVEMPRMDGFDLTAKIRADNKLAGLPVILVTALESREHRERGIDAGANAYIVKSGFDQANLLEVIRRLI